MKPNHESPSRIRTFHSALITFCFAGAVCLAVAKAHTQNIVANPGFESGPTFSPWSLVDPDFGGVLVQTFTDVGLFSYQQFTFANLLSTGSSTPLEFRFVDNNDFFRLDDVSVNVPEPSATALLALPVFAGLLLLHSRLRTKKSPSRRVDCLRSRM